MLVVTLGFVLLAMGLFYVTRLAAFRETWLHNKLAAAHTTFQAFEAGGPSELPADLSHKILASVGVKSIAVETPSGWRTLAAPGPPPVAAVTVDLDSETFVDSIGAAFQTLFAEPGTIVHVSDASAPDEAGIAIMLDETPLKQALWRVSHTILHIALMIAAVVACVLWAALWRLVLRPVRRLTTNIIGFGESPQDVSRVIAPSGRRDEIGRAETALAAMERSLAHELAQRKRLAELGMAVARINHDLRNILTAAQLISDRLAQIPDPLAQRLAPRLVATLDRAIQFCQATLTYGAARERAPDRRPCDLDALVRQVVATAEAEHGGAIDYHVDIPPRFEVYADPDHILRVLENLSRNAAQALIARGRRRRPAEGHPLRRNPHRRRGPRWKSATPDLDSRPTSASASSSRSTSRRATPAPGSACRSPPISSNATAGQLRLPPPRRTISIAAPGFSSSCRRPNDPRARSAPTQPEAE